MILDNTKSKQDNAMQSFEKIEEKRKLLTGRHHKLLDKAMSSAASAGKKKNFGYRTCQESKKDNEYMPSCWLYWTLL